MANLPEKNITTVDKITSIPSNTNLYINANGEFRQATIDDVLKASPVIADSIANQYKNASGSPLLLTDSAEGVAIDFNAKGRSTQAQYSGKNLANVKDRTSQTREGITSTITNKIISASGTATSGTADIVVDLDTPITIKSGTYYTLSLQKITGTMSTGFTVYLFDTVTSTYPHYYDLVNTNSITFNLASDISCSSVLIRLPMSHTINGTFRLQLEEGTTATVYEPYVGGTASPNPSYPQAIKSVGDMGYFDGELALGIYSQTGAISVTNNYVTATTLIPCNSGDTIKFSYEESARLIVSFFNNGTFIKQSDIKDSTELSVTVPSEVTHIGITVNKEGITPQTAKHICVTINDKYALIVDSVGKNLLDISKFGKISQENVAVKDNTITVASGNYVFGIKFGNEDVGLEVGKTYTFTAKSISGIQLGGYKLSYIDGTYDNVFMGTMGTATITKEVKDILFYISTPYTGTTDVVIGDMQIEENNKATDYEPYKKSRKYIPISAPLRGKGEVTDVASLSECKVDRKFVEVVFDGSADEGWIEGIKFFYISIADSVNPKNDNLVPNFLCSHFTVVARNLIDNGQCSLGTTGNFIIQDTSQFTTLNGLRTWLQSNPITVIYELAEPTTESIKPIDVDTFEGVTQISVSDDADMEVEYPASKVAGIASIGWSKGRRAEYDLEQLKAQMLALQTTIVSTV